jgi:uncharacterized protein YcfJ
MLVRIVESKCPRRINASELGEQKMINENKVVSLAIIGIVLGGVVGAVFDSEQINLVSGAIGGGVIGFLVGWVWNTQSGGSK